MQLRLLSAVWHENLVPLIGYCCEKDQQILVYPFMSNGSLQDRLYGIKLHIVFSFKKISWKTLIYIFFRSVGEASKRKVLDWPTRLSVCIGAARGTRSFKKNSVHFYSGIELNNIHAIEGHAMLLYDLTFAL